jgi:branched-chain amino acid transport system permease protein
VIEFLQLLVQGISLGATYALVALGFVVIYRASGVINFAQGAMLLLGAYLISWLAVDVGVPFGLAVLAAMAALSVFGAGFHRVALRRVVGQPTFVLVMITIGAGIAVTAGISAIFGDNQRLLGDPWSSSGFHVGSITITWVKLWGIVVAAAGLAVYFAFDRYTRWGLAMRATAADEEATLSAGVPVRRVHALTWGDAALRAFPAVVLGGLSSSVGAVAGGVLIGVVEVMTSGYAPSWLGTNFYAVAPYVAMIAILLVRPYGLLGVRPAERL